MSIRWKGLAGRIIGAAIFGGVGLFLSLVVILIWQSPADHESWLSALSVKMFFLLMVGSIAGYAFHLALGGAPEKSRPAPPSLAEVCPACGHLGGAPSSTCPRCGLLPEEGMHWAETHPGTHFDDLMVASMMTSLAFLGLFMLAQIAAGAVHGVQIGMYLLLGLLLGAVGMVGPVHLVTQVRDRRRKRGHYTARFIHSPESNLWNTTATAQLDRHGQLVSAEGLTVWKHRPTLADPASLEPAHLDALRSIARLEWISCVGLVETRHLTWSRRSSAVPRVERFVYRDPTSDEAWTCVELRRPRIKLFAASDSPENPRQISGWRSSDTDRSERLSKVLGLDPGHEVSLDEVLDRVAADDTRRAALRAIADEVDPIDEDDEDDEEPSDEDRPIIERRVRELTGWLVG